jgi:hypothetical protein
MQSLTSSLQSLSFQNTGRQRNVEDKYYTKREIALYCTQLVKDTIPMKEETVMLEPSAGDGAFVEAMQSLFPTQTKYFFDINPEKEGILQQDYLLYVPSKEPIHIIGNPPFGRQSSIAKKFIKHSCIFAKSISFILPKSFKKQSFQTCFDINFHKVLEEDLPSFSFLVNGKEYDVPCVFQIWVRKDVSREIERKVESIYFDYVNKDTNPDFCIRRVGVYAGSIYEDCATKSSQSHYFCKLKNGNVTLFVEKYKEYITFTEQNTAGPKSISKHELNKATNNLVL